ncbi:hypothetical protein ACTFIV_002489 [Dictyostelium citrinum]
MDIDINLLIPPIEDDDNEIAEIVEEDEEEEDEEEDEDEKEEDEKEEDDDEKEEYEDEDEKEEENKKNFEPNNKKIYQYNKIISIITIIVLIVTIGFGIIFKNSEIIKPPDQHEIQLCSQINDILSLKANHIKNHINPMLPIETFNKECKESNVCDPIGLDNLLEPLLKDSFQLIDSIASNSKNIDYINQCKSDLLSLIIQPLKLELHKKNNDLCKFNWIVDDWGNCNNSQCPPLRERKVTCISESNHLDFDERNPQCCNNIPKPISSESCGLTYSWSYGEWSNCTGNCGSTFRKANCLDCIGTLVDDSKCSHIEKEPELLSCQPTFGWKESEWIKLKCWRGGKIHTGSKRCNFKRNVWCESCGNIIDDSKCQGKKPDTTKEEKY